ncbi:MAG: MBL fold metallo-hydrolase, partial [Promethearchaeota archaeon]
MRERPIITESGKINDYIHHVDLMEYGLKGFLSCYVAEFDEGTMILDCGSSLCVKTLLEYLKKENISLSSILYLTTTHHHYDHVGGLWKLYEEVKKHNPRVRILTNKTTKELLINNEYHLHRA